MDGDVHLGRPTLVHARAQPVADHLFPLPDGGLGSSAFVVPGSLLPSHAPVLGDALEIPLIGQLARRKWPIPAARTKAMRRSASSAAANRLLRSELAVGINKPERVGWPISGIRFERQEGCPCMVEGTRPGLTLPEAAQAGDRCNKADGASTHVVDSAIEEG